MVLFLTGKAFGSDCCHFGEGGLVLESGCFGSFRLKDWVFDDLDHFVRLFFEFWDFYLCWLFLNQRCLSNNRVT